MKKLTLKDYIVEYQNGNEEVLNKLITLRETKEKNNNGDKDVIYRLRFTDKALHNIYLDILHKYSFIDGKDIDSFVLAGFTKLIDKVDVSKEPNQIIKWFRVRLDGLVQNEIESENKKYHDNISADSVGNENEYSEDDEQINNSRLDQAVFEQYTKVNDLSGYKEFIEFVGGSINKILSVPQQKVYKLLQSGDTTQEDIAKELNCSQENVSQIIKAMNNRIRKEYLNYRTYKALAAKPDTYQKVKSFLDGYNLIVKFDVTNSFDYFGYVCEYIRNEMKNTSQIELDFLKPEQDPYSYFTRNKDLHNRSVIDVLVDGCNKPTYSIIQSLHEGKESNVKETAQDKFVMDIVKVFNQYIKEIQSIIKSANGHLVENGLDGENKIFDKVS
jgi:RNA polymerase sigma factor (sigma-70 family)